MQVFTEEYIEQAIQDIFFIIDCKHIHPEQSCNQKALNMFLRVIKPVTKTYIPIHILPVLLFKRKQFIQNPVKETIKVILGIIRSVLFGAGYYCSFKRIKCLLYKEAPLTPSTLKIMATLSGLPLLFEQKGRQAQIALFTVYKTMQTAYNMGIRRGWPVKIPAGTCLIPALALALLCHHYFNNRNIFDQVLKDI